MATILGIVIGNLLSKLFAMILLKLLDSTIEVRFSISLKAIVSTLLVFAVIMIFTSIRAYRVIYRFKLIELFQADHAGEATPKASITVTFCAVLLIAFGYWLVFQPMETSAQMGIHFLLFLGSLISGTYLLFRTGIIYMLKAAKKKTNRITIKAAI